MISFARSSTDLYHILFGNVLAVRDSDMFLTAAVLGIVLISVPLFYKQLKLTSFAPTIAKSYGWNISAINYGLMFLLTLVAVTSLQTVGTILVIAMLITPAATAYQLTDKLLVMIVLSTVFGTLSSIIGFTSAIATTCRPGDDRHGSGYVFHCGIHFCTEEGPYRSIKKGEFTL